MSAPASPEKGQGAARETPKFAWQLQMFRTAERCEYELARHAVHAPGEGRYLLLIVLGPHGARICMYSRHRTRGEALAAIAKARAQFYPEAEL